MSSISDRFDARRATSGRLDPRVFFVFGDPTSNALPTVTIRPPRNLQRTLWTWSFGILMGVAIAAGVAIVDTTVLGALLCWAASVVLFLVTIKPGAGLPLIAGPAIGMTILASGLVPETETTTSWIVAALCLWAATAALLAVGLRWDREARLQRSAYTLLQQSGQPIPGIVRVINWTTSNDSMRYTGRVSVELNGGRLALVEVAGEASLLPRVGDPLRVWASPNPEAAIVVVYDRRWAERN